MSYTKEEVLKITTDASNALRQLNASMEDALTELDKLARLGNGDKWGNSTGNIIAQACIQRINFRLQQLK